MLKIKFKQNPDFSIKEYNVIFEFTHVNIRTYPRSKKISIDQ